MLRASSGIPCTSCSSDAAVFDPRRRRVEAAHIRFSDALYAKGIPGMQAKPSDAWTVPLAHDVHMAQHAFGDERLWWSERGINPLRIAALLFVHSGDDEAARIIIANARRLSC